MLNFRKVVERGNGTANLNEDQANYEKKVGKLEKACENFGNYLKTVKSGTPFPKIIEAFEDKNKGFREQMEKNKLFSRTSKVLQEMRKNLSKFKKESFDPSKIDDYVRAFWFKAKKSNSKGYIKRSAIDDAQIVKFFTGKDPNTIPGILNAKKTSTGISASKTDLSLKESISRARQSFSQTQQTIATAKSTEKENQTAVETVKENPSINQPDKKTAVTRLTSQQNSLTSDMKASQKTSEQLASSISRSEKILSSPDATDNDKKQERKKLEATMETNNAQTQELEREIKQTENVGNQVAADITNAENKTTNKNKKNIYNFFKALKETRAKVQQTISSEESAEKRSKEIIEFLSGNNEVDINIKNSTISALTNIEPTMKSNKQNLTNEMDELENKAETIKNNPNSPNNEQALNSATEQINKVNALVGEICQEIEKTVKIQNTIQPTIQLANVKARRKAREEAIKAREEKREEREKNRSTRDALSLLNRCLTEARNFKSIALATRNSAIIITNSFDRKIKAINGNQKIDENIKKEALDTLNRETTTLKGLRNDFRIKGNNLATVESQSESIKGSKTSTVEQLTETYKNLKTAINEYKQSEKILSTAIESAEGNFDEVEEKVNKTTLMFNRMTKVLTIKSEEDFDRETFKNIIRDYKDKILKIVIANNSITTIRENAFSYFTNLTTVELGNVTEIGRNAFANCGKLENIDLSNITSLSVGAFLGCRSLEKVDLGKLQIIYDLTFAYCTELKSVNLPKVTFVSDSAFVNCTSLKTLTLPETEDGKKIRKEIFQSIKNTKFS